MFEGELDARVQEVMAEAPSPEALDRIVRSLPAARPVRALPSDAALAAVAFAAFVLLCCVGAAGVGFQGYLTMSPIQKLTLFGTLAVSAVLFAFASVEQMIPGARRRVAPGMAIGFPVAALALIVPILFPHFEMIHFVKLGFPCLRLGTLCAVLAAVLVWLLMRRGFLANPVAAASTAGAFSGFAGVGVLALHCPLQNAPHILVWHVGVLALPIAAGAAAGWLLTRRSAHS